MVFLPRGLTDTDRQDRPAYIELKQPSDGIMAGECSLQMVNSHSRLISHSALLEFKIYEIFMAGYIYSYLKY